MKIAIKITFSRYDLTIVGSQNINTNLIELIFTDDNSTFIIPKRLRKWK